jgi:hypothetical protein
MIPMTRSLTDHPDLDGRFRIELRALVIEGMNGIQFSVWSCLLQLEFNPVLIVFTDLKPFFIL